MKKGVCVSLLTDKLSTARAARFFEKAYGRFLPEKGAAKTCFGALQGALYAL